MSHHFTFGHDFQFFLTVLRPTIRRSSVPICLVLMTEVTPKNTFLIYWIEKGTPRRPPSFSLSMNVVGYYFKIMVWPIWYIARFREITHWQTFERVCIHTYVEAHIICRLVFWAHTFEENRKKRLTKIFDASERERSKSVVWLMDRVIFNLTLVSSGTTLPVVEVCQKLNSSLDPLCTRAIS